MNSSHPIQKIQVSKFVINDVSVSPIFEPWRLKRESILNLTSAQRLKKFDTSREGQASVEKIAEVRTGSNGGINNNDRNLKDKNGNGNLSQGNLGLGSLGEMESDLDRNLEKVGNGSEKRMEDGNESPKFQIAVGCDEYVVKVF